MEKLTRENLTKLGFEEEYVSAEESGDEPFSYFVYEIKDEFKRPKCILISGECDDENGGGLYVEFFNTPELGIFDDYETLKELLTVLKKAKFSNLK